MAELAPVILVAAAITLLGYGTLVKSSYPPLRSIGIVSAVSVVALAGASVLVLPALLMGTTSVIIRTPALIPAFNEARSIAEVVDGVREQVDPVVVVDDGSTDGTAEVARAAGAEVLSHETNRGKGNAIRTGLAHVLLGEFTHVLLLDGDMQHLPHEAPTLLGRPRAPARIWSSASGHSIEVACRRRGITRIAWAAACCRGSSASRAGHAVRVPRVPRRRASTASTDGARLRNRNRDARQGAATRRPHRERAGHGGLRGAGSKLRPVRDTHEDVFSGGVLSIP